jgi:hypothetical protein
MTKKAVVDVCNVPEYAHKYKYWVVRFSSGYLWYYGGFDDENRAIEVANTEDGMVVTNNE